MKFHDIRQERISDLDILFEKGKYIAHTPKRNNQTPETLEEHIKLVEVYFLRLIERNGLEPIVDGLIDEIVQGFNGEEKLKKQIKLLFYNVIIYHDFGKINHLFQQKDGINNFNKKIKERKHKEGSNHSSISAYLFLVHYFLDSDKLGLDDKNQTIIDFLTTCFSYPIFKHHSSYLSKIDSDFSFTSEGIALLADYLTEFSIVVGKGEIEDFHDLISDMETTFKGISELKTGFDYFPLFALLKLNYSLLTASDFLATSDYISDLQLHTEEHFGLLTDSLKQKIIHYFDNNVEKDFNGKLIREKEAYLSISLDTLQEKSNENLNLIRQKLGAEVLANIEKHKDEKVFYIEAPTGGGKTNMSMVALRKMLELHPEINKVFYVFPFTTLITQTAKAIKETLGLSDDEVALLHSKAGFQTKDYVGQNEIDAQYGKEKRNQIDNLFVNYPFVLMTHIKFFDVLKSNKKDSNYLLHRLANSVVIIDELQAYNPDHWDKIKYFIAQYAELFNIRFVIMSATLPKIDEIELSDYRPKAFISLIPGAKKYLQNPNFAGRVEIKTDLLKKKIELSDLANLVFEKSKNYAESRTDKDKGSVYTIVEFIFKKTASKFYEEVEGNDFFDEVFVLSGTILEHRRKFIIDFLKDSNNRKKKILLITTQVVEAGVDIDMDLGFKNQSLLDSDEQLAGRINRNVNKKGCELWLFNMDNAKLIYGKDIRYEETLKFDSAQKAEILSKKTFGDLYRNVFAQILKNNKAAHIKGFDDYKANFRNLDFKGIQHDFKLIDSENINVFVPVDIPIQHNFSANELAFLNKSGIVTDEENISGEEIWELHDAFITDKGKRFSIESKVLNGIMSKFVFSVFSGKVDSLFEFLENPPTNEDNQRPLYFKLRKDSLDLIYSEESGLNDEKLKDHTFIL